MGEFLRDEFDPASLDVMVPKMYIHDSLKLIYINEAYEEALEDKGSKESEEYRAAKESHPGYETRLRRIPITVEFMRRYARLRKDSYMLDLIKRKEAVLREDDHQYEMTLFFAFKNMFLAKYPECKNVYKTIKRMDAYEEKHPAAGTDLQ